MQAGLIVLCLAYVLSQFFRAFLAVLSSVLARDLGTVPDDLATASGLWFASFALMQLPVGWALDRIGPRRTAASLLLIGGGGGAALFALATSALQVKLAMLLIGIGCSPVLMASYYIFAREFPPRRFATLAALMLGVGSVGNLVASYPTALAAELIGWRGTLAALAALSGAVAIGIFLTVRDPETAPKDQKGSVFQLLKLPVMWAILPMMLVNYAPSGALRGLWIGPYLTDVFALSTAQVGQATFVMGLAMIVGTFTYGPLDRVFGTRKWVAFFGNLGGAACLGLLVLCIDSNLFLSIVLIALIGFLGGSFPMVIAHGRGFFPPHLVGRGVTLMNLFGIGGVGLTQFVSGRIHEMVPGDVSAAAPYAAIFGFFGLILLIGTLIYGFSRDSMD
ncbi:MFS transporter [Sedimentitalea sp. JM2-8]|uniref:MFS transporter n=1 Tax=Sedimentitalea xiamensis TaxID=3050037 RepID=A0ABT7FKX0_9RHOB|nr:MFS transporter [Sedimentitalea xiamensis]MDK3075620.1 MFS transporter [Sedimentitalea xiamensis]